MAAVFAFLREADVVPEEESFHRLVSSLSVALNSQVKALLSAAAFLEQKRRETCVSFTVLYPGVGSSSAPFVSFNRLVF